MRALRFAANVASYWILGTGILLACSTPFTTLPDDVFDAANDWIGVQDTRAEGGEAGTVCDCPQPKQTTYDVECSSFVTFPGPSVHTAAIQSFPGKTRADLAAHVQAIGQVIDNVAVDAGVGHVGPVPMLIEDGTVTVDCGKAPDLVYRQITFVATF